MHVSLCGPLILSERATMEKKGSKKCLSDEEDKDERFLHLLFNKFIFQKKTVFEQMSA